MAQQERPKSLCSSTDHNFQQVQVPASLIQMFFKSLKCVHAANGTGRRLQPKRLAQNEVVRMKQPRSHPSVKSEISASLSSALIFCHFTGLNSCHPRKKPIFQSKLFGADQVVMDTKDKTNVSCQMIHRFIKTQQI